MRCVKSKDIDNELDDKIMWSTLSFSCYIVDFCSISMYSIFSCMVIF